MKKVIITLFAAALALISCNKHEVVAPQQDLTVRFSTEQLSSYAFKSALEADDQVGVFAGTPIGGVNVLYTATADKKLTSATPLKWIKDSTTPVDFTAYRPYNADATTTVLDFAVQADQNAAGAYDASDLMAANASQVAPETVVSLTFKHQLSKVAVKLTNNVEGVTITGVTLEDVALGAKVDLVAGTVSDISEKASVKAMAAGNDEYDAIIIPQTARPMIVVTLSNGLTYKYLLSAEATFAPGKVAVANLAVNPGTPSEEVIVVFSFTVLDWEEGEELAAEDPIITGTENVWKVVGLGGDWTWAGGVQMTGADGVWEADITYAEGDEFKLNLNNGETWAGMKSNWAYYGLGDFEDGYLDATDAGKNIVLQAAGDYHLTFTWPSCKLVITAAEVEPEPQPGTETVWKVVGLGGDWTWANGVALTETDGVWKADITLAEGDEFKLNLNPGETWAGMKSNWAYYGLGEFDDGYLDDDTAAKNIVVKADANTPVTGTVHIAFTPATLKLVLTVDEEPGNPSQPTEPQQPATDDVWKVVGLGGDWDWDDGIALTETDGVWEAQITLAEGDEFKLNLNNGETWVGMKPGWSWYGLGEFDDGYLDNTAAGVNIVVKANAETPVTGDVTISFTPATLRFVVLLVPPVIYPSQP